MRYLLKAVGFLLLAGIVLAGGLLAWEHLEIRRIDPTLPPIADLLEPDLNSDLPVRLTWINTASQPMPRAAVLEPDLDPHPEEAYTMSHPTFVVEWPDGRLFLIDMGMNAEAAIDFGRPLELLADADPIVPHASTSTRLGEARSRVAGIAFTHMHTDHTTGLLDFCRDRAPGSPPVPVFQHHEQVSRFNHTTRPAKLQLEQADCIERRSLGAGSGLIPVDGFKGLFAIPAGGHTPGSTMYVVQVRGRTDGEGGRADDVETWVLTGDVVNHVQGIELGLPKPRLYSLLMVPEDDGRLGRVRDFLQELGGRPGVTLLVSHDQNEIQSTGLARW
jgi:glyoxylase-like metal-dependent hydrolase (beta-lactamase superfamily II)